MCTHWDIVGRDGTVTRDMASQRDELLAKLRSQTTPGENFDGNVRFPTPHLAAAMAELRRRQTPFNAADNYATLDEQIDQLIEDEEVVLYEGVNTPDELVGTGLVDGAGKRSGMTFQEVRASIRAGAVFSRFWKSFS